MDGGVDDGTLMTAAALLLGYLLGSVPFGLILTRASGAGDIRAIGSGNIGATNVLRTGRKGLAAATLILDAAKGAIAVLLAQRLPGGGDLDLGLYAAAGALIGHCYPVWLSFKGGKGIATAFGLLLVLAPFVALWCGVLWLGTLAAFRFSSLASLVAAAAAPLAAAAYGGFNVAALFLGLAAIVIWKHRANVERLLSGEEPRVGRKA